MKDFKDGPNSDTDQAGRVSKDAFKLPVNYNEKDVQAVNRFADEATALLHKLHLDGGKGVSRATLNEAEKRKGLSKHEVQILDGLLNLEPSMQDAWSVPNHRAHLRMNGSRDDALESEKTQAFLKRRDQILEKDRQLQYDTYQNQNGVDATKLDDLKFQATHVKSALHFLAHADEATDLLMKKLQHAPNSGLTLVDIDTALARGNNDPLRPTSEKVMLLALCNRLLTNGMDPDLSSTQRQTLDRAQVKDALTDWAANEVKISGKNPEHVFFSAIEGYSGRGYKLNASDSRQQFDQEMDFKDKSQISDYERERTIRDFSALGWRDNFRRMNMFGSESDPDNRCWNCMQPGNCRNQAGKPG